MRLFARGLTCMYCLQAQSVIAAISNSSTQVGWQAGLGGLFHICMFGVAPAAAAAAAADYVAV